MWISSAGSRHRVPLVFLAAMIGLAPLSSGRCVAQMATTCRGDCDANGSVAVNELVTIVGISLGDRSLTDCVAVDGDEDGAVAINEIVQAVGSTLDGCSAPPSLYGAVETYCAGTVPFWVVTSDLDNDAAVDVVVVNRDSDDLSILLGDGAGGFASTATVTVAGEPRAAAARDYDGDGIVELPDIDGDGDADIVTANRAGRSVAILRGHGDGTFAEAEVIDFDNARPQAVSVDDLDGDGELDLVVVSAAPGDGDVRFLSSFLETSELVAYAAGVEPRDAGVADFDGDGRLDVVVSNRNSDDVSVFFSGDEGIEPPVHLPIGERPRRVAVGDVDGDALSDIVTVNVAGDRLAVLRGDRARSFAPVDRYPVGNSPQAAEIGDLDGDGRADVVVANRGSDDLAILLGSRNGLLRLTEVIALPESDCDAGVVNQAAPVGVAIGDLDGDGGLDLIVANSGSGSVSVLLRRSQ